MNEKQTNKDQKEISSKEEQTPISKGTDKNGKPKNKGKSQFGKRGSNNNRSRSKGINDPDWYIPSDQIAKDTANIPFNVYAGLDYLQGTQNTKETSAQPTSTKGLAALYQSVPGLIIFKYLPSIGTSTNRDSAINIAGHAMYAYIRSQNSGAKNYEASDLTMYVLGAEQIYLMIQEVARVFVAAQEYTFTSRLVPEKLVKALGYDIVDIQSNLADYRRRINIMIQQINTFAVPNEFNLIKRRSVLASTILMDDADVPKQLIIPESDGYYTFDPKVMSTGGALIYTSKEDIGTLCGVDLPGAASNNVKWKFSKGRRKLSAMLNFIQNAIRAFTRNTDQNTISGDILRAYGADKCFKLNEITSDYKLQMLHDPDLLEQFKNSTVLDVPGATLCDASTKCAEAPVLGQILSTSAAFSKLMFKCPRPTNTSGDWDFLSVTPVITQINDNVVFSPTLPRIEKVEGQELNKSTSWFLKANTMTSAGFKTKSSLLLDSYKSDVDYKMILEYTRLMMLSDLGLYTNSQGLTVTVCSFNIHMDGDLFRESSTKVSSVTLNSGGLTKLVGFETILSGTEIGLGWLVVAPDNLVALMLNDTVENVASKQGICLMQWFQNHTTTNLTHDYRVAGMVPLKQDLEDGIVCTLVEIYKIATNDYIINNNTYIHNIMMGLDFSPRPYNVGVFNLSTTNNSFSMTTWIYYTSGKFGNKTGIVAKTNLKALHETALIGLISKRAYDRIESKSSNSTRK